MVQSPGCGVVQISIEKPLRTRPGENARRELINPSHPIPSSFRHDIDISPALSRLLLSRLAGRRCAEQIIDTAGVAHAGSWPAGRPARGASGETGVGRRATQNRRRPGTQALLGGLRNEARHRLRRPRRRRHARTSAGWWKSRGRVRHRSAADRSRSSSRGWWGCLLGLRVLCTGLLVDPALELRVVDETACLAKLGTDRLPRGSLANVGLGFLAAKPAAKPPALFARLLRTSSLGCLVC